MTHAVEITETRGDNNCTKSCHWGSLEPEFRFLSTHLAMSCLLHLFFVLKYRLKNIFQEPLQMTYLGTKVPFYRGSICAQTGKEEEPPDKWPPNAGSLAHHLEAYVLSMLSEPLVLDSLPWPGYESTIHVMAATISSLRDRQDHPKLMISKSPNSFCL